MKKLLVLVIGLLSLSMIACHKDGPVSPNKLPNQAKQFIEQHFPNATITSVVIDDGEYEVWLNNGTEIDFNLSGAWKSVDCHMDKVPDSIIPPTILAYVTSTFPQFFIVKIEKDFDGYDIKLNNGMDLDFTNDGHLRPDYD